MADVTWFTLIGRAVFCVAMVVSFYGWGALLEMVVGPAGELPAGVDRGGLGMGVVLALGAGLNALHLLNRPVYLILFLVGLGAAVTERLTRPRAVDGKWLFIFSAGALVALPMIFCALDGGNFNHHDDYLSYLVMPIRINQLGTLQIDPFNFREVLGGAGGMAFLQAPIIDWFGVTAVRLVDQGVGLLLVVAAMATLLRRLKTPIVPALLLVAGTIALTQHQIVNITSYFTTLALLICLCGLQLPSRDDSLQRPIGAAVLFCGIAALKNIAVPFAGLLCGMIVLEDFRRRRGIAFRNLAVFVAAVGAVMGLWYLPRFGVHVHVLPLQWGHGTDQQNLRYMLWWMAQSRWNWIHLIVFAAIWAATMRVSKDRQTRQVLACMGIAVVLGSIVTTYETGAGAITRYSQFDFLVGYLFCGGVLLAQIRRAAPSLAAAVVVCAGFVAFKSAEPWAMYPEYCSQALARVQHAVPYDYPTAEQIETIGKVQAAIPPGSSALICMKASFLLDFRRNRLFIEDFPRAVSPAPGIPREGSDQRLVNYLRKQSIRYVAYGYADQGDFPDSMVEARLKMPLFTPWQRRLNKQVPILHRQLSSLGAHWPRVYDDGSTFVIDIGGPAVR